MCVFSTISKQDPILTTEQYPIHGDFIPEEYVRRVNYSGLNKYWNCFEKAEIAKMFLGGNIALGKLYIFSDLGNYGFEYNPPYEFHAWLEFDSDLLFDGALPGVMEKARIEKCSDREPVILNGKPERWMQYERKELI